MDSPIHPARRFSAALVAALILGISYVAGQYMRTQDFAKPVISVQGMGKVSAVPDIALLNFGVQTSRVRTAQEAMQMLGDQMNGMVEAVKALGIEPKDITTQNLWMNPSYDYYDGRRVDSGFEASQNLQVKVRDLAKLTAVLDAAVSKGANQVGGVSFTIDDPDALQKQARDEAIADAKKNAAELAANLGMVLGRFKGYGEGGMGPIMPMPSYAKMDMMEMGVGGGGGTPLPSGEQEIVVSVSLMYELR